MFGWIKRFGSQAVIALARALVVFASARLFVDDKAVFKGTARVVGQSRCEHIAPLDNPSRDADAIGKLLEWLGFAVHADRGPDRSKAKADLQNYVAKLIPMPDLKPA